MRPLLAVLLTLPLVAQHHRAPAGTKPASTAPDATVLPGGRLLSPLGTQHPTGPGPFGLAVSEDGTLAVTADGGPDRFSLTVLNRSGDSWSTRRHLAPKKNEPADDEDDWRSTFMGLALDAETRLYASEGESGRIRRIDPRTNRRDWVLSLNQGRHRDSYTGDLALDHGRGLLYVVDQANFRLVVVSVREPRIVSSVRVGRLPFAVALSPDGRRAYVTHLGLFEYQPIPGADPKRARETGLPFPAFGYPSPEAEQGVTRPNGAGQPVRVPGLGSATVFEANSLGVVNVEDPARPRVEKLIPTGTPLGGPAVGGSSPSGVVATADRVFVSNAHNDSITVVDARTLAVERTVPLRIPGLERLRGVLPIGLAADGRHLWVAEAGINAVGLIDLATLTVQGHLPVGWFPTRVAIRNGVAYVASAKGRGTGQNAGRATTFQGELRRGMVSIFPVPGADALPEQTRRVLANNGFLPEAGPEPSLPSAIRHVVLIVKENRTHDEVFGDLTGQPSLARFGRRVTPNHHALADRGAISANFYADSEVSVDGHHWLVGAYPNAWTESSLMAAYGGQKTFRLTPDAPGRLLFAGSNSSVHPEEYGEAGTLWHHLERHGIPFRNYGEGFELAGVDEGQGLKPTGVRVLTNVPMPNPLYLHTARDYPNYNTNIPDQFRATQFLADLARRDKAGERFPRFVFLHLPNDHIAKPRPADGYPSAESYVADNDLALGRIVDALSRRPEWRSMAVLVTEDDAQGGVDHIDSHRTVLMVLGPYAKRGHVSPAHSSFPGLLKTAFRLLGVPPLTLFDATASDLADCFTTDPDLTPYTVRPVDAALFDPAKAREPLDPTPSPRMDDPRVLREQHRSRTRQ